MRLHVNTTPEVLMKRLVWIAMMGTIALAAQASRPRIVDAQPLPCGDHCVTSARCDASCWNCNPSSILEGGTCGP